jgi:hypothetical protein
MAAATGRLDLVPKRDPESSVGLWKETCESPKLVCSAEDRKAVRERERESVCVCV